MCLLKNVVKKFYIQTMNTMCMVSTACPKIQISVNLFLSGLWRKISYAEPICSQIKTMKKKKKYHPSPSLSTHIPAWVVSSLGGVFLSGRKPVGE